MVGLVNLSGDQVTITVIFTDDHHDLRLSFLPVWIGEPRALGKSFTTRQSIEVAMLMFDIASGVARNEAVGNSKTGTSHSWRNSAP